jgi:hypothetical protein
MQQGTLQHAAFCMCPNVNRVHAVIYKQEKRLPAVIWQSVPWKCFKWFISHAQLNIFCQTFLLQKWALCWSSIKAFHGVPHILSLCILALGAILPTPRGFKEFQAKEKPKPPSHQDGPIKHVSTNVLPHENDKKAQ